MPGVMSAVVTGVLSPVEQKTPFIAAYVITACPTQVLRRPPLIQALVKAEEDVVAVMAIEDTAPLCTTA